MKPNKYQKLCLRTVDEDVNETERLSNWCMGIAGESGELIDHVKKQLFHDHPADTDYIKKELGDILWYMSVLATEYGIKLSDIMLTNINKLKARYPDGFDTEKSINRDSIDNNLWYQSEDVSILVVKNRPIHAIIRGHILPVDEIMKFECHSGMVIISISSRDDVIIKDLDIVDVIKLKSNISTLVSYLAEHGYSVEYKG